MTYQLEPNHGPMMRAAMERIAQETRRTRDIAERDRLAYAHDLVHDCIGGRCREAAV